MSDSFAIGAKRYTAIFYAVGASLLLLRVVRAALITGPNIGHIVIGLALVTLAIGLATAKPFALKTTGALCLLFAIFLPIAVFNPLAIGDYLVEGKEPPSFPGSLIWLIPLEIFLLFSVHVLDPRFSTTKKSSK